MVILSTWKDSVYTTAITLMHQLTGILLQQCNNTVSNFSSISINLQQSIIMYCVEINLGDKPLSSQYPPLLSSNITSTTWCHIRVGYLGRAIGTGNFVTRKNCWGGKASWDILSLKYNGVTVFPEKYCSSSGKSVTCKLYEQVSGDDTRTA